MARLARIVIPGIPHFVTQRGNEGRNVFFDEADALFYRDLLAEQGARCGLSVWAWCLMPNRIHLLAVPGEERSLGLALGETHRRYAARIRAAHGDDAGPLWKSRFSSFPLEEDFILPAAHFIEMTPVMAGLCKNPAAYRWSSARAHLPGGDLAADPLCDPAPLLERAPRWEECLAAPVNIGRARSLIAHSGTGRPLGGGAFLDMLEDRTGRALKKRRPGRKKKDA